MGRKRSKTDNHAPAAPTGLTLSAATGTSVTLSWSASGDNVGVSGYELFLNGNKVGATTTTSYGFGGLSCGQSYSLAVDAYDTAGNRSPLASVQASTSPCPDTQAPSLPSFLVETSATVSSISLSWQPSLDNVGVAGYTVYANGSKAGTTGLTLYTLGNLACGHSYTLAVDAYDAAGNHSAQSSVVASTAPCVVSSTTPQPTPTPPAPSPTPTCNFTLSPGQSLPAASAGQTICLHGGTYSGGITYGSSGTTGSPITIMSYPGETALISGPSSGTGLTINGSYVKLAGITVTGATYGVRLFGANDEVSGSTFTHNAEGLRTEPNASNAYVHDSTFTDNNREVSDTCSDAYGANGILVVGNNGHFSHNRISGSWSTTQCLGYDGTAVEIYGGSGNLFDDNYAFNNESFVELGRFADGSRPADNNKFYYNVIYSTLPFGAGAFDLHGNEAFGPTYGTLIYNNSIYVTSPSSNSMRCGACTSTMATIRNNIVKQTGAGSGLNWSGANEDYDDFNAVIWGGTRGAHTITSDPLFVSPPTNLDTQTGSPTRGAGTPLGLTSDFVGTPVPSGGSTDMGAYQH